MKVLTHPIKIVFFDIDNTLYHKDEAYIPDSITQSVIPRLKAKGIIPAIATGRCLGALPKHILPLLGNHGIELLSTINGQHNRYRNQTISEYPLATARIESIIAQLTRLGIEYSLVSDEEMAVSKDSAEIAEALAPIKTDYIVAPDDYKQRNIIQMQAFYPEAQHQVVVEAGIFGDDLKAVRWHPYSVDILNKHHSKALGINDIVKHFDLTIDNVMAFGDELNDVEMIGAVGYGVAMGNAIDELKARADFITKPIDEDGILYALEKLGVI